LIPLVLELALSRREALTVFGCDYPTRTGTCIRDYVHVSDLTQAHIHALQALQTGRASMTFNLGTSREYTFREVVDTAASVTFRPMPLVENNRRIGDPVVIVAESDVIRNDLGCSSVYGDLETIIETA